MARSQPEIVWECRAYWLFGMFQTDEVALCANEGHSQCSFFTRFGLNWNWSLCSHDVAILHPVPFTGSPTSRQIADSWERIARSFEARNFGSWEVLKSVRTTLARRSFDALPAKNASIDGP